VTDVRKAVRFGRKSRCDLPPEAIASDVFRDHLANEVAPRGGQGR
jgi:hypothetical protein